MSEANDNPNFNALVRHVYVARLGTQPNIQCRPIPGGVRARLSLDLPKTRQRAMVEDTDGAVLELELTQEDTFALIDDLQSIARDMGWLASEPAPKGRVLSKYRMTRPIPFDATTFAAIKQRFDQFVTVNRLTKATARFHRGEIIFEFRSNLSAAQQEKLGYIFGPLSGEYDCSIGLVG